MLVGEGTEASREFGDAITLEEVAGEFILEFETDGSMGPKVAFMKASLNEGNEGFIAFIDEGDEGDEGFIAFIDEGDEDDEGNLHPTKDE